MVKIQVGDSQRGSFCNDTRCTKIVPSLQRAFPTHQPSHPPGFTVYPRLQDQGRKRSLFNAVRFLICLHSSLYTKQDRDKSSQQGLGAGESPPRKGGLLVALLLLLEKGKLGVLGGWEVEGRDRSRADTTRAPPVPCL